MYLTDMVKGKANYVKDTTMFQSIHLTALYSVYVYGEYKQKKNCENDDPFLYITS